MDNNDTVSTWIEWMDVNEAILHVRIGSGAERLIAVESNGHYGHGSSLQFDGVRMPRELEEKYRQKRRIADVEGAATFTVNPDLPSNEEWSRRFTDGGKGRGW